MKCAVPNCISRFKKTNSGISFFKFPRDPVVRRQWLNFCRTNVNPNSAHICKLHFKSEDFSNALQLEMGLANKRILKRGAVPTIYIVSRLNPRPNKVKELKIKKRKGLKSVDSLYKSRKIENENYNTTISENNDFDDQYAEDILIESFPTASDTDESSIFTFLTEMKHLKKQNKALKVGAKKQAQKIESTQKKMLKLEKKQKYKLGVLENKVNRAKNKFERLEEIFEIINSKYVKKPNG